MSGLSVNFSTSKWFNTLTYITQNDRKSAESSADLIPENFGFRDQEAYEIDVENIDVTDRKREKSRGLRENSVYAGLIVDKVIS